MDTLQSPHPSRVLKRRAYLKRLKGLKKKAYELKTLADVEVGMVFYDPNTSVPSLFPEDPDIVASTMKCFLDLSLLARDKKRFTLESMKNCGKEDPVPSMTRESEENDNRDDALEENEDEDEDEDEDEEIGELNLKRCSEKMLCKALRGLDESLKVLRGKIHEKIDGKGSKDGVCMFVAVIEEVCSSNDLEFIFFVVL